MTKEALEKEAKEWLDDERKYIIEDDEGVLINISKKVKEAYIASAEPREKRITELENELREVKRELEEERFVTTDLKQQIEKMKCCANCKHYTTFNNACMEYGYFLDKCDKTKWEIKEK